MKRALLLIPLCALLSSGETRLGKPLRLARPTSIADLVARADSLVGKTVQVKGKITEVCQSMGCWMQLKDPDGDASIRIQSHDHEIVFPQEGAGKLVIAEGKLTRTELNRDQAIARARHEAEEQGRAFDPKSVKGPVTIYHIQGTGAVVLD